ncbi:MAG TPA: arginase [Candidatus Eisenbacteria bacterium]|nr:arginase [Candidatus Eisenbacteria bacterium]
MTNALGTKKIRILGVPIDLGAGRRGVDMGPSALRVARLGESVRALGYEVEDGGDVPVRNPEEQPHGDARLKFRDPIRDMAEALSERVASTVADGCLPVILGGDHSVAIGSTAGLARALKPRGESFGIIWFDAHADMNVPESTPSGNIHGMALAVALGLGDPALTQVAGFAPKVAARNAVLVGTRSIDDLERDVVRRSGIHVFTMRDIDERGMRAVMSDALAAALDGTKGVHVSLDIDFMDPDLAPGTGTVVRGGVTEREAHLAMEMVADTGKLLSMDVTEINPVLDERNQTARLAVDLTLSALGKRVY